MLRDESGQPASLDNAPSIRRATADKVLEGLKPFVGTGKVFQTSLDKNDEKALCEVLQTPAVEAVA